MFTTFLLNKYSHLRSAYGSDKEMIDHFMSGEVTIPFIDAIKYQEEWEKSKEFAPRSNREFANINTSQDVLSQ